MGLRRQTALGELTALPRTPDLYLCGLLLKGGKRRFIGRGEERKGRGREGGSSSFCPRTDRLAVFIRLKTHTI